jgi:transcriptional regulator with XRE-family HTH domain
MTDLIKRLEKFRLENRISQLRVANYLKVSFSTVNRWFNDKADPNKIQRYHIQKLIGKKPKASPKKFKLFED